jgi:hypothetical protein
MEARLSSSLPGLSSAHGVKQRRSHRFLIPGDPALTIGCVKGGEPSCRDVEDALYSADREVRHCGMGWLGSFEAGNRRTIF